ncbi:NlpC/P60 family protein [Blastomonas sp.]|uniref:NlpC/P60 family protein n=1 Tax=Blastomonas sp. TaxID=1909299 RepID=UPI0035935AF2
MAISRSMLAKRFADRASGLIGVPFRLHGRSAETGLDCVGLAVVALARAGWRVDPPSDYRLRGGVLIRFDDWAQSCGFRIIGPEAAASAGDLLLCQPAPDQFHLLVYGGAQIIHAHAGIGRVVAMPLPTPWPVVRRWRLQEDL